MKLLPAPQAFPQRRACLTSSRVRPYLPQISTKRAVSNHNKTASCVAEVAIRAYISFSADVSPVIRILFAERRGMPLSCLSKQVARAVGANLMHSKSRTD